MHFPMNKLGFTALLVVGSVFACGGSSAPKDDPETVTGEQRYSPSLPVPPCQDAGSPACVGVGKRCKLDSDCCAGFCNNLDTGYGGYGYGYGYGHGFSYCSGPLLNGFSCVADNQCASGHCDQYECKAAVVACAAVGKACNTNTDCCGNAFCNTDTYAPPTCTARRANGEYCYSGAECASGNCVNYQCQ